MTGSRPADAGVPIAELPSALDARLVERLSVSKPIVLADYDGTLTPIVARPELAILDPAAREALERLSGHVPVGIISGRDLADVRSMVAVDGLWYAGSHGFDLLSPDGTSTVVEVGLEPVLDAAEATLRGRIAEITEAWVERKRFAIAVHYRQTPDELVDDLAVIVRNVGDRHPGLRMTGGKKIFELRPEIPWDKGRALSFVCDAVGRDRLAVYLGDDETDEDAFEALGEGGIGIVVGDGVRPTAASYRLVDPAEVVLFLDKLADRLVDRRAGHLAEDGPR